MNFLSEKFQKLAYLTNFYFKDNKDQIFESLSLWWRAQYLLLRYSSQTYFNLF